MRLTEQRFAFAEFLVDAEERRLTRDGTPLDLSSRYFDALLMLVRNPGKLISRDEFLDQAWRGVPVTDEALTQCIKTLRRQLGDGRAADRRGVGALS